MLFVSSVSPRLVGLNGSLLIQPTTMEQAGQLIFRNRSTYQSLITFESTCDVLAVLAGIDHFHRQRDLKSIILTLKDGDQYLIVSIKESAKAKKTHTLGVFDFDYTLCEFRAAK